MKNKYEIRGDVTAIFTEQKFGRFKILIDTNDLTKIQSLQTTWFVFKSGRSDTKYYAKTQKMNNGIISRILMHRLILDAPSDLAVDHIDGNSLNNRRSNLRLLTKDQNNQNVINVSHNLSSGARGVSWHKKQNKWVARITSGRKRIQVGSFNSKDEAIEAVKRARAKLMPYSKEALEINIDLNEEVIESKKSESFKNQFGVKNVSRNNGKWRVRFGTVHYGYYDNFEDAQNKANEIRNTLS